MWEPQRTVGSACARSLDRLPSSHGVVVARRAVLPSTLLAVEEGDRAAEHALPIDKLIAMLFAHFLTVAQSFDSAALAHKFIFVCILL